jgi:mannosylglycerate hydrolase MGH1-like protein
VDSQGNNIFEGGFLGLDNITVVDRSTAQGSGIILEQSDATGWMAFFCLNLMKIALELSKMDSTYELLATKFFEHFVYISAAMKKMGGRDYQLWDEQDGFFYDVLRYPNGDFHKFRVRSLVGLIPLYAIEVLHRSQLEQHKTFLADIEWFIRNRSDLVGHACCAIDEKGDRRYVLGVVDRPHLSRIMARLLDPAEFLSPAGIRSLSKFHLEHPFHFGDVSLKYEPAESAEKVKGGNSNWRGPVWFPTTYLLIESLVRFSEAYGADFAVPPPGRESTPVTPKALAADVANRLISIFKRDQHGSRPCYGMTSKFQQDPHWRDYLLFHEYFNGDDGAGLGATHQTGWTGLVANLITEWRR